MLVYIAYEMKDGAYGGGNQFLKALRDYLKEKNMYTDVADEADVVIFNSYNHYRDILRLRKHYPNKLFIHRVDGPCKIYNNNRDTRDDRVYRLNSIVADATVFQSDYCRTMSKEMGGPECNYEIVIHNACNPNLFYPEPEKKSSLSGRKIMLIASSFSSNINKGFDTYKWLDEHLDFTRYEMAIVGNSPYEFSNIKHLDPMPSAELAEVLRKSDIYISASVYEACSNSLLEAMACGLPVLVRDSSSNPELVNKGGLLFKKDEEIPGLLDSIIAGYKYYSDEVHVETISNIGDKYIEFADSVIKDMKNSGRKNKRISSVRMLYEEIRDIVVKHTGRFRRPM